jgi:hypothetical protein
MPEAVASEKRSGLLLCPTHFRAHSRVACSPPPAREVHTQPLRNAPPLPRRAGTTIAKTSDYGDLDALLACKTLETPSFLGRTRFQPFSGRLWRTGPVLIFSRFHVPCCEDLEPGK